MESAFDHLGFLASRVMVLAASEARRTSHCHVSIKWFVCALALAGSSGQTLGSPESTFAQSAGIAPKQTRQIRHPAHFFGPAALVYSRARECSDVLKHLFCYCGCDVTQGHESLFDCVTSLEAADSIEAQREVELAWKLHRQGVRLSEIQRQVDEKYAQHYPFARDQESQASKNYMASRRLYEHKNTR